MQALINRFRRAHKPVSLADLDRFDWRLGKLSVRVPAHLPASGTTVFRKTA